MTQEKDITAADDIPVHDEMPVEEAEKQREENKEEPAGGQKPDETEATEEAADPLEVLHNENTDLKDRLLRALAEVENTRRRAVKDLADARAYSISGFARDMLNVVDNLRRAIENMPAEASQQNHPLKNFLDGIELTERDLLRILERHGMHKIDPKGEKFDPHKHQAVFEMPDAEIPTGHVAVVVQPGFSINERVLRPAMVGVSKGAAAHPQPPQNDQPASGNTDNPEESSAGS